MDIATTIDDMCPRCGAPWGAVTMVNRRLNTEELNQIATPRVVYACGSTFHEEDHAAFGVPAQESQTPTCVKAELAKHRGA